MRKMLVLVVLMFVSIGISQALAEGVYSDPKPILSFNPYQVYKIYLDDSDNQMPIGKVERDIKTRRTFRVVETNSLTIERGYVVVELRIDSRDSVSTVIPMSRVLLIVYPEKK